jgi:uncharacterized membrane protein
MVADPAPEDSDATAEDLADELPGVERLLTLSDGVVAIALTLLVLQLKVPVAATTADAGSVQWLRHQLSLEGPQFTSYLISFYVIGQFWLAHHRVFRNIGGHREGLAWWNFAFLLSITLMPFTSDLLGEFSDNRLAIDIFAVNLLLASLTTQATYIYARNRGLVAKEDKVARRVGIIRTVGLVIAVGLSIVVAQKSVSLAKYCWLLIAVVPLVADGYSRLHRGRSADGAEPAAPSRPSSGLS